MRRSTAGGGRRTKPQRWEITMGTQATMTEKDMFLASFDREFATTRKLLRQLPAGKEEYKPAPKSRNVRELAWIFIAEEKVAEAITVGELPFGAPPPAPKLTVAELIAMYEASHAETLAKIRSMSQESFNRMVKFPVGPGQMGDLRAADVLWTMLMDAVHHRGQLSVYLRLLDAKVPSIYGPTADEPWS
jgi:uncharacterized damage-inducible protein DinB